MTWQTCLLLRLAPFDTSTTEGRWRERHRRIALTTASAVAARLIGAFTTLISVPLSVSYLGTERYGLWMTIASIQMGLAFADLGMGNGLLNAVSEANGRDDAEAARKCVSSAFFLLTGIAVLLLAAFLVAYPFVPWPRIFNVTSPRAALESGTAMAVFMTCFALSMPLGVVQKVQIGYQEGFANNIGEIAGALAGLGGLLLAIHLELGLPWLVLAISGGPLLGALLNWLQQFGWSRPWLLPRRKRFDWASGRKLMGMGMLFFLLQAAMVLAYSSDNIIGAQLLGPSAVARYSVARRLYFLAPSLLGVWLLSLWPAYGEAIARGDAPWVRRTLFHSTVASAAGVGVASAMLLGLGNWLFSLWVGPDFIPSWSLSAGLAVWAVVSTAGNATAMYLNGSNALGAQAGMAVLFGVVAVGLKIFLCSRAGVAGIVWGTLIAYLLISVPTILVLLPRLLRRQAELATVGARN